MKTLSWLSIAIVLAACGKSGGKPETKQTGAAPEPGAPVPAAAEPGSPAPAAATGPENRCDLTVTGDLTRDLHLHHPRGGRPEGKLMAATDYWMTEPEIRRALEMLAGTFDGKLSESDRAKKVDENMKADPRIMLLMINCGDEEATVILGPGKSHYADVPYGPRKYPITAENAPGHFGGMISFRPDGKHESYAVAEPGELDITKFDATGITGTFHFKAKRVFGKPDRNIEVTGKFDYACAGGTVCK